MRTFAWVAGTLAFSTTLASAQVEWRVDEGGSGHVYIGVSQRVQWTDAKAIAAQMGGYIVSIESAAENDWLITVLDELGIQDNPDGSMYIGLSDARSEGTFVWESGAPLTDANWACEEPNDPDQDGCEEDYGVFRTDDIPDTCNGEPSFQLVGEWVDAAEQCGHDPLLRVFVVELECSLVADITGDGIVDTLDFLLFLGAWAQGDPIADWDGNGTINTLDFLAYLNDWVAGC